ncbi:hypothetical protein [Sphingopyxis chilensis]|uniref:hypothetical protein n=1 Tax=Sphingopyxis chilensis TaxID=180400 RepID=UPI002DDD6BD9|nr:hypothetical protein [Sphingopyxis chilensis]
MAIDRREAIALTTGLVAASAVQTRAEACTQVTLMFSSTKRDNERMIEKFEALRRHWNEDTLDEFFSEHCISGIQAIYRLDGRGKYWGGAAPLAPLHDRYPKIIGDFSGYMFHPFFPAVYSMGAFEAGPNRPRPDYNCGTGLWPPVLAVGMHFKVDRAASGATLSGGSKIVTGLMFQEGDAIRRAFNLDM